MLFTRMMITLFMLNLTMGASVHWSIDWSNSNNLISGSYASKNLIPRLSKLDGILKKRVLELEEEIDLNFTILMIITSMMAVVLVSVGPLLNETKCHLVSFSLLTNQTR